MKTDAVNNLLTKIILETATPEDFFAVSEVYSDLQTFFNSASTVDTLLSFGVTPRGLMTIIILNDSVQVNLGPERYLITSTKNNSTFRRIDENRVNQISHRGNRIYDINNTISRTEV